MGDQYEPLNAAGGAVPMPGAVQSLGVPPPPPPSAPPPAATDQNQYEVPQFPPTGAVPNQSPAEPASKRKENSKRKVKSIKETASTVLQSAPPGMPSEQNEKEKETVQADPVQQKTVDEEKLKTEGQDDLPTELKQPKKGFRSKFSKGQCACVITCSVLLVLIGALLTGGFAFVVFFLLKLKTGIQEAK